MPHESPKPITIPLIVLAFLAAVAGLIGIPELFTPDAHSLEKFLAPIFEKSTEHLAHHHVEHGTEWILLVISVLLIIAMIVWAIKKFSVYKEDQQAETGVGKLLENKWYVDEIYDSIIVKPLLGLGAFFNTVIEKGGIDKAVNAVGRMVHYGSRQFRLLQSGNVGNYLLIMVVAIIILIRIVFYLSF